MIIQYSNPVFNVFFPLAYKKGGNCHANILNSVTMLSRAIKHMNSSLIILAFLLVPYKSGSNLTCPAVH